MTAPVNIALAGAGLIGRSHAEAIRSLAGETALACIVDPSDAGRAYAETAGVPWFPSLRDMFAKMRPDGALLATPNQVHVENGLECVAARCPALVEKPIATTGEEARGLVDVAAAAKVPILVGHHRRHNPLIQKARAIIDEGRLGRITVVQGTCWFFKPDDYFAPEWRRKKGAGPILVNTIHDIDLLRYLCGGIDTVHAFASNTVRGFEPEDTAAVVMRFNSGAVGTFAVSDATAAPWSWETTTGENPAFSRTTQSCYRIGGTKASLSFPEMALWGHGEGGHWKTPISATHMHGHEQVDPIVAQIRHFAKVIRGEAEPLVSGEEAMKSLRVVEAIKKSATTGETVFL